MGMMKDASRGMMSARSRDDVEECSVAFLGGHVCAVMTKKGLWRWNADWRGRVGDVGGMWVKLGVRWRRQPSQNVLKLAFSGVFGQKLGVLGVFVRKNLSLLVFRGLK